MGTKTAQSACVVVIHDPMNGEEIQRVSFKTRKKGEGYAAQMRRLGLTVVQTNPDIPSGAEPNP